MITWKEKVVFVGLSIEDMGHSAWFSYNVKVTGDYLDHLGRGHDLEDAIEDAVGKLSSIDWSVIENMMTENYWQEMSHT